jgi:hypothetical protein
MERDLLISEISKLDKQLGIVAQQIQNTDYNITGLIAQNTRYMDRRDLLETKKADLETQLASLAAEPLE